MCAYLSFTLSLSCSYFFLLLLIFYTLRKCYLVSVAREKENIIDPRSAISGGAIKTGLVCAFIPCNEAAGIIVPENSLEFPSSATRRRIREERARALGVSLPRVNWEARMPERPVVMTIIIGGLSLSARRGDNDERVVNLTRRCGRSRLRACAPTLSSCSYRGENLLLLLLPQPGVILHRISSDYYPREEVSRHYLR